MAKEIPRVSITLPDGGVVAVRQTLPPQISENEGVYQGTLSMIKIVTPDFTNPVTTNVCLYDKNGVLLWQSGALAEASGVAGYAIPVSIPLSQREYFTATPSGDPGAGGGIVTIDCSYIPDVFVRL